VTDLSKKAIGRLIMPVTLPYPWVSRTIGASVRSGVRAFDRYPRFKKKTFTEQLSEDNQSPGHGGKSGKGTGLLIQQGLTPSVIAGHVREITFMNLH